MIKYSITFARSARKELQALDATVVNKIFPKIESLSGYPRPENSIKLKGGGNLRRIRIGVYRVIYAIDDDNKLVDIIAVRHRKEAYR
jgi:mRNA interferase RelE/StbE